MNLSIPGVVLLKPNVIRDQRGFFLETFRSSSFEKNCSAKSFVQENHSGSSLGVLRGLHLQTKNVQGKLVRVLRGSIYDVVVDLRCQSPTYGRWLGAVLNDRNHHQLWVPEGFAHGFLVTSDYAEIAYKCTNYYDPRSEVSLLWNDPQIGIEWPFEPGFTPILSDKDSRGLSLARFRKDQLEKLDI